MDLGIDGKVAMVAAATRGIGFAAAKALANEGARISVCGVDPARVERAAKSLGPAHRAYRCNLASAAEIESWIRSTENDLGLPAILVTNTGGPPAGAVGAVEEAQWRVGFENTLLNVVRLVSGVAPNMKKARWGRIVHISSLVAKDPDPVLAISSTLRAGLSAMCRLQALELGPFGITVNCVLPGYTDTDRLQHVLDMRARAHGAALEEERRQAASEVPLKRLAKPEEIGDVICFLCSERAGYVSGAQLVADGGISRGPG